MSTKKKTLTITKTTAGKRWTIQVSGASPELRVLVQGALRTIAEEHNVAILNGVSPWDEPKTRNGNAAAPDPLLPNLAVGQQG